MRIPFFRSSAVYFGTKAFVLFSPISIFYTAVAHVCLHVCSWRPLTIQELPSIQPINPIIKEANVRDKRVAIVTGSNTGIGYETAKALAERGYHVILACRSRDKAMIAAQTIPNSSFLHPLDLSSKSSIEKFAAVVKATYSKIHLLVNNAGLNTSGKLEGGLDLCFQTNFLGHFLLTNLLLPELKDGRVINLSSVMHHYSENEKKDEAFWTRCATFHKDQSTYTPSKLAALLFTIELNKRGIRSIAVNPGAVNSDIWRGFPRWVIPIFRLLYLNNQQGCYTSVAACLCNFESSVIYLQPYWMPWSDRPAFPPMEMLGPFVGYAAGTPRLPNNNGESALALWKVSENITGCHASTTSIDEHKRE